MGDQNKVLSRPIFRRDGNWDPFADWKQPSPIFKQDFNLPPFLDSSDLNWIDWARRRLAMFSWPGYPNSSLLNPFNAHSHAASSPRLQRKLSSGVSEIRTGLNCWKVNLDINHFLPEEITITVKEDYLEISGNHEDREDERGSVLRCFTRKYKLPQGVDLRHISSSFSTDGTLSVEAPVPGAMIRQPTNEIVIPIQISQSEDGKN